MIRRLPVFLLVDVSESMCGDSHTQLSNAVQAILQELRTDPQALETVHLSLIAFAGKAKTLVPLCDILTFQTPTLPIGGGTALGQGLEHLFDEIDRSVHKTSQERKGDWKPMIFLLTDGHPTDSLERAHLRWQQTYQKSCQLIAVSIGGRADHSQLRRFTKDVVVFDEKAPRAFASFVKWVSASISITSRSAEQGLPDRQPMAGADPSTIRPPDLKPGNESTADARFLFLVGKCQANKLPYLLKYEASASHGGKYRIAAAHALPGSYFDMTDVGAASASVNTSQITESHSCPQCEAKHALCFCACGGMLCIGGPGKHQCPWCDQVCDFEFSNQELDLKRSLG